MDSNLGYIMTISNSIIGVSILAMPYCFKQCGIILAIVMLLISNIISRLTCHFLLKSAIMTRRRTFELLAFHAFGTSGKFMVELGIIGFLMGTCIAFFVIIGDLGPAIIAKMIDTNPTDILRTYILVGVAVFCVLPLGLLKNVDSLNSVSTATIGFYFCLVLKTISESERHFETGDWLARVELWQPSGILQCLPIFAMAMSCQTQLFEIYDTLPNATLEKMNYVIRAAVNICVCVYICVGFFGYVAFSNRPFTGNILMSFSPSWMTDVMKVGFVLSVAFSFPLVIFPCRASLYSLLYKKGHQTYYEGVPNFIPESKFKVLTLLIVTVSLVIGLLIPNIEVVLGLVGSTIGTLICIIFPVTCFICISTKNTNERLVAQFLLFLGVLVMVMGTYRNLYAMEEVTGLTTEKPKVEHHIEDQLKQILNSEVIKEIIKKEDKVKEKPPVLLVDKSLPGLIRVEPPQPIEPQDSVVVKSGDVVKKGGPPAHTESSIIKPLEALREAGDMPKTDARLANLKPDKKAEEVDSEAIKKEDKELQEEEKYKQKEEDKKKEELLKTLQKHKKEQESLLNEQKEILKEIKEETKKRKDGEDPDKKENEVVKHAEPAGSAAKGAPLAGDLLGILNRTRGSETARSRDLPLPLLKQAALGPSGAAAPAAARSGAHRTQPRAKEPPSPPSPGEGGPGSPAGARQSVPLGRDILADDTRARSKRDTHDSTQTDTDAVLGQNCDREPPGPDLPGLQLHSRDLLHQIKHSITKNTYTLKRRK